MNVFDIIIAALLLFGLVRGIMKGLFIEVASLVALIAGVYGAIHFSYFTSNFLEYFLTSKLHFLVEPSSITNTSKSSEKSCLVRLSNNSSISFGRL